MMESESRRREQTAGARIGTRVRVLAAVLTAVLTMAACGGGEVGGGGGGEPPSQQAIERGRVVYDRICATCHARDGGGVRMLGASLRDNAWVSERTDRELLKLLQEGRPATDPLNTTGVDMPPKGGDPNLSDEDLANVVAYLRTF